jgi:flagellar biosynthesis protein FlhB
MSDSPQRQLAPTPRQRQEARQRGYVALSREFVFALMYAAGGAMLLACGPLWWSGLSEWFVSDVRAAVEPISDPLDYLRERMLRLGWWLFPWLMGLPVVVVLAHWIQHGPLWLPQRLCWNPARVDPLVGAQRLIRARLIVEVLLAVMKISLLGALVVWLFGSYWTRLLRLTVVPPTAWAPSAARLSCDVAAWLGVGLLVWGGIDFAWRLFQHERDLRMSPEELREDVRAVQNHVSDPRPRSRRRN